MLVDYMTDLLDCLLMDTSMEWKEAKPLFVEHITKGDKEELARILYDALTDARELEDIKKGLREFNSILYSVGKESNTNIWYNKTIRYFMAKPDKESKLFAERMMKEHGYNNQLVDVFGKQEKQERPKLVKCSRCDGTGKINIEEAGRDSRYDTNVEREVIKAMPCPTCSGTGKVEELKSVF